jgi:NADH dehydrogenase FAD-containing subunit
LIDFTAVYREQREETQQIILDSQGSFDMLQASFVIVGGGIAGVTCAEQVRKPSQSWRST